MNTIIFAGKLFDDARVVTGDKGNFISFTLYETGKGKDAPKLDVTQNFKGDAPPSIVEHLKKSTTVIVSGTPYAKFGKDREGNKLPVLAAFANNIDIVCFATTDKSKED